MKINLIYYSAPNEPCEPQKLFLNPIIYMHKKKDLPPKDLRFES